ncbi:hypothetical protein IOC51_23220 [Vibrio parahaemolyticus]|uniref:hypothetical protein n=1 Tax=Vibrio parahaemolyticus TaxID=670 RepID=UPI001E42531F|nr:hypothetical protein [Vibrio parahaemolyticus]MCD1416937.1 hypothetical protein [Vibrio parahaemolyticus]
MEQTFTQDQALAFAYFKEGFPYGDDNHRLFEHVSDGGDLEFFLWILEQVIPVVERYLTQFTIETPDKLYVFYGNEFPARLKQLLTVTPAPTPEALEQCAEQALCHIADMMRDIRQDQDGDDEC